MRWIYFLKVYKLNQYFLYECANGFEFFWIPYFYVFSCEPFACFMKSQNNYKNPFSNRTSLTMTIDNAPPVILKNQDEIA
jgi:hypothetical protein